MKRFLITVCLLGLIAMATGLVYAWVWRVELLSSSLSKSLQMSVQMEDVSLSFHSITLKNLSVEDAQSHLHFSAAELTVIVRWNDFFSNPRTIEQVKISQGEIRLRLLPGEEKSRKWSLSSLKDMWNTFTQQVPKTFVKAPPLKDRTTYRIQHLNATHLTIEFEDRWWKGKPLVFPLFSLNNVDSDGIGIRAATQTFIQILISKLIQEKSDS